MMKANDRRLLYIFALAITRCASPVPGTSTAVATNTALPISTVTAPPEPLTLGAGFRFSTYGTGSNPGPEYFVSVGEQMAEKFPASHPEAIWIVGEFYGGVKTYLSFHAETEDPNIVSGYVDMNEASLDLFDENGFKVWLQVEPAYAEMLTLIDFILNQYKHHPSIMGFGVDVEWYKSDGSPLGTPITDEEAEAWVKVIRAQNPNYRLLLKHWESEFMPPTYRDGIVFIDDGQHYESLGAIVDEFSAWGAHFAPAPVGFQYGYLSDKSCWKDLKDPPADIGNALLQEIPNTVSLFWVDFTLQEIFPP